MNDLKDKEYSYPSFMDGYESGNPVEVKLTELKELLSERVIAKAFLFMLCALLVSGYAAYTTPLSATAFWYEDVNFYLLTFLELGIVAGGNIAISKNKPILAGILYFAYAYLTGMILAVIFDAYNRSTILTVFFVTAGLFGVMAVYGLITERDLSRTGSLFVVGLIGVVIADIANLVILKNTFADTLICSIGVILFMVITAMDTQKIRERVYSATDEHEDVLALYGGFQLYLDFVNLFLRLLSIMGKRKK